MGEWDATGDSDSVTALAEKLTVPAAYGSVARVCGKRGARLRGPAEAIQCGA